MLRRLCLSKASKIVCDRALLPDRQTNCYEVASPRWSHVKCIHPHNKVPAVLQSLPLSEIQMKEHEFLCALLKVSVSYVTISLCMHMLC